ncbi:hypothetical protein CHARACLAT_028732 [Characodon lateralis]|uniref:Uncharacterized protein n=1 Tax=Characodon lateralis TaxID=208331 RepID=A0ABU7CU82_9TELE|nr:hypothetical protein [Characodon lateralis]
MDFTAEFFRFRYESCELRVSGQQTDEENLLRQPHSPCEATAPPRVTDRRGTDYFRGTEFRISSVINAGLESSHCNLPCSNVHAYMDDTSQVTYSSRSFYDTSCFKFT